MKTGPKRGWIALNVSTQILAALVTVAAANILAFEFYTRFDLSRSQRFLLSSQTKQILRELEKPLEITVIFSRTSISPTTALYSDVTNLLDEFVFSGRKKIRVRTVDPIRDLTLAREMQAKYQFRSDENLLILAYDGRSILLPISEMAEFDVSAVPLGGEPKLVAFLGEETLAASILTLVSPTPHTVYFLQGHGEPTVGTNSPISKFLEIIAKQNVRVKPLLLEKFDSIPEDASALYIVGAQTDISPREATLITNYQNQGHSLCILFDPTSATPVLNSLAAQNGIEPRGDRVLRTVQLGFATGILRDVTVEFSPKSPITRRLSGLNLLLPGNTQSLNLDYQIASSNGILLRPLMMPLEPFWGERDHQNATEKGVRYEDGIDFGHPLYVAASAAKGGLTDDRVNIENSKFVALGNSQFLLDAALSPQGLDFMVSVNHWLLDRSQFTGTTPRNLRSTTLRLMHSQLAVLSASALLGLPSLALLFALIVWFRRKK